MTKSQTENDPLDEVQTPSKISELHRLDRVTSKNAGAPLAWRKISELQHAYDQERLGTIGSNKALERLNSGHMYGHLWDCSQSAGRDSTASFDVVRSMGSGMPLTEHQAASVERLVRIEMHLGRNDRTIIRGVCAWGYSPVEAMELAKLKGVRVSDRLCEAMDALTDAIERTAKSKPR